MTEAQSKRTRLAVWKDILVAAGGTPSYNDTLHRTVQKAAEAAGVTVPCCHTPASRLLIFDLVNAMGGTAGFNDTIYQLERKLMVLADSSLDCCSMPPLQALDTDALAGAGLAYLLDEQGNPILDEQGNPILLEGNLDYPPTPFAHFKLDDADPAVSLVNTTDGFNLTAVDVNGSSVAGHIGNARQMGYLNQDWWFSNATSHWRQTGSFTVRLWIKPIYNFIAGVTQLLRCGSLVPSAAQWNVGLLSDTYGGGQIFLRFTVATTGGAASVDLTTPITLGQWNHVMCWFEQGVGVKVQLNNGTIFTGVNTNPIDSSAGSGELNFRHDMAAQPLYVDDMAIWNQSLNSDQRFADYNSGYGITYPL